ncbi:inositol phosphorylceramide synthase [Streptacidiphilus sp. PB12-B1b]|uniref:phosphatase PAP2 family protein n=1 Tax=Streptacidiphilus sp. PB12-B1b TaxID=2705012 RepID=UPI0015F8B7EB|nr:phosphatase PAP2 family protein [Streptacidiphilus sp. PB12-B1b]QMU74706.1 inositol phosphorylceramide synthase [Streptacidiphilus sp. PB12-B1b]
MTSAPTTRSTRRGIPPLLPARLRRAGRPAWWAELLLTAIGYGAYSITRNAVPDHQTAALHRAQAILHVERELHVSFELALNHAADHVTWLIVGMDYYYATLHFIVTIAVLLWLYFKRPGAYRAARTALYAATALALVGFYAYALAPPRFLTGDGFIDTVVVHHTWGSWASGPVTDVSNQFAAMPSIHIAWSTWCAVVLYKLAKPRLIRVAAVLYPCATCVVILATANHFETDALAGLLTIAAGFAFQRLLTGQRAFPRAAASTATGPGCDGSLSPDRPARTPLAGPVTGTAASPMTDSDSGEFPQARSVAAPDS